jgi:terminal uridylyltransferase
MDQRDSDMYSLVMQDLEQFIRNDMPNAKLELFGSTKNGFGARKCDLDICLTFEDNETGEGLEYAEIIEKVGQLLRFHTSIRNIIPITSAKVPIVKFTYFMSPRESIDCDISLYNILARYNTLLLRAYCLIDQRVQILGFIVKHFAKVSLKCNIFFSNITLNSKAMTLKNFSLKRLAIYVTPREEVYHLMLIF